MFETVLHDARFAVRALGRIRGFAAIAIATLAAGIGSNTAIFSIADAVILRPLRYRDSGRLYSIHEREPRFARIAPVIPVNALHFREWRANAHSFDTLRIRRPWLEPCSLTEWGTHRVRTGA